MSDKDMCPVCSGPITTTGHFVMQAASVSVKVGKNEFKLPPQGGDWTIYFPCGCKRSKTGARVRGKFAK